MITRAQFDDLSRRVRSGEEFTPTRARAVLRLIGSVDVEVKPNRREKREAARQHHRHPAQQTARQRRKHWHDPSPQEAEIRELNRLMRSELERAPDDDGNVSGPLAVVARYVVPTLLNDFGLPEGETPALEHWLMAKFGDVLRDPDIPGYLAWRDSCRRLTTT